MEEESITHGRHLLFERSRKRALDCLCNCEYSRAFAHLIIAMNIQPDNDDIENAFLFTLGLLSNELEVNESWNELLACYQEALEVLPYHSQILHGLATALFRLGHVESATSYFQKAYKNNPSFSPSLYCVENIRNTLIERWHFMMLNDKTRNSSFAHAVKRAVAGGHERVLDIGAGTGILSMLAVDSGAKAVYACESNPTMFSILQNIVEENKKDIQLINKFSFDIDALEDMKEKVSLVITETFDAGLFGEHALEIIQHAWNHLLGEGINNQQKSQVIPKSASVWALPLQCQKIHDNILVLEEAVEAMGLSDCSWASSSAEEPYTTEKLSGIPGGYTALSDPCPLLNVDFNCREEIESLVRGKSICQTIICSREGHIDAVAIWFDLHLDDEITISTTPEKAGCCWEQAVFYAFPKIFHGSPYIKPGDQVTLNFFCSDHLALREITTQTDSISKKVNFIHPIVTCALNSSHADNLLELKLFGDGRTGYVADVSTVPILGLKALLQNKAKKLFILPSKYLTDLNELQKKSKISEEVPRFTVLSYEQILMEGFLFDVIVTEPVDMCGLLKKNAFEEIALLKTKCSTGETLIYPKQLSIYAMLIESSRLCQESRIVSDENCMGYKISKFLNVYQSKICQDIQLSTMPHEKLCDAVKLCSIDLDKLTFQKNQLQSWIEFSGTVDVEVKRSGQLCAIPFWFNIAYDSKVTVNTLSSNSSWKQSAIVLEEPLSLTEGDSVRLKWICRNSCLHITVSKTA